MPDNAHRSATSDQINYSNFKANHLVHNQCLSNQPAEFGAFASLLDRYSVFKYGGYLSSKHRWTSADIGRQFLLVEEPDQSCISLLVVCEVSHIEDEYMVEFKLIHAEKLYRTTAGDVYGSSLIDTDAMDNIEFDGNRPFRPYHADQVSALIGDQAFAATWNLLSRIQYWAFQPTSVTTGVKSDAP